MKESFSKLEIEENFLNLKRTAAKHVHKILNRFIECWIVCFLKVWNETKIAIITTFQIILIIIIIMENEEINIHI